MLKAALAQYTRVADVMTKEVVTVPADATPKEAAAILAKRKIGGAPVVMNGQIAGLISKSDLIEARAESATAVKEIMTRLLYAVRPGDPVMLAVKLMVDEAIHRVVVVDESGDISGVVAPIDVLRALRDGKTITLGGGDTPLQLDYVDLRKL